MHKLLKRFILISILLTFVAGCSPKVGSKEWCEKMDKKAKGEWSSNEAKDYAKSCIFK
ncbi:MAG: DUF3012 domain-containing protein [Magnetococcales bacterium]|nr:DUF3012 domain-containing protein [Magnetococcales bacterium]